MGKPVARATRTNPLATGELDPVTVPRRSVGLPVTTWVDQHGGPNRQRGPRAGLGRLDRPVLTQEGKPRRLHHQMVSELEEGPDRRRSVDKGEREHEGVRRDVSAGMVADEQHGARGGDPPHVADLRTEPGRDQRPGERKRPTDVAGIALVQGGPDRLVAGTGAGGVAAGAPVMVIATPSAFHASIRYTAPASGCASGRSRTCAMTTTELVDAFPQLRRC